MITEKIVTKPKGESLRGINLTFLPWSKAISELIDNSLDAKANRIIIERPNKNEMSLEVTDDGEGCENLENMVRQGGRQSHGSRDIGRYGVGFKDVAIALWGEVTIRSFCKNKMRESTIVWDDLFDNDFPPISQNVYSKKEATEYLERKKEGFKQGTKIIFLNIGKSKFIDASPRRVASLFKEETLNELSFRYTPALEEGKNIEFINVGQSTILSPWKDPIFKKTFQFEDEEVNGKMFSLKGGIVMEGEVNERPGFHLCHPHRFIETTGDPCGEHGTSRIFAWVFLSNDWLLEKNKTKVLDKDREILMDRISSLCRSYIEEASSQPLILNLEGLENELSNRFTDVVRKAKEQREKGNEKITIPPKETERKRIRIVNIQNGQNPLRRARADQIKIEFVVLGDKKICDVYLGDKIDRIHLNKMNSKITQYIKDENKEALLMMAACFYSAKTALEKKGQLMLHFKNIKMEESAEWNYLEQGVLTFTKTVQSAEIARARLGEVGNL